MQRDSTSIVSLFRRNMYFSFLVLFTKVWKIVKDEHPRSAVLESSIEASDPRTETIFEDVGGIDASHESQVVQKVRESGGLLVLRLP